MSAYDSSVLRQIIVQVYDGDSSRGSGCIVPSTEKGLFYCLTARHCVKNDQVTLFAEINNGEVEQLEYADIIREEESGPDAAILKLAHPLMNYPQCVFVGNLNQMYSNAVVAGFPIDRGNDPMYCGVEIQCIDSHGKKDIQVNLQNINTYNASLKEQIIGISGGGCFALDGTYDYKLLGIETRFADEQQSFGEIRCLPLSIFNDLLQRNGWPLLACPKYQYASLPWNGGINVLLRKQEYLGYDAWVDTDASPVLIQELREHFSHEGQEPFLLAGFSGTGKTRTVLQACTENQELSNALIFDTYSQFLEVFNSHLRNYCSGAGDEPVYLIVDDLKFDNWFELKQIVRPFKNIRLVAIMETGEDQIQARKDMHKMPPCGENDVIRIIQKSHPSLSEDDRRAIYRLSNNDLRFALLIAHIYENAPDRFEWDMQRLSSDSTSAHIIVQRIMSQIEDLNKIDAVKILALFVDVGYVNHAKKELEFLGSYFSRRGMNPTLLSRTAATCIQHHLGIEKGSYFELSPRAFAILLFTKYYPELINNLSDFMNQIPTDEMRKSFLMRARECGGATWEEVNDALASWFQDKYGKTRWERSANSYLGESCGPSLGDSGEFSISEAMIFVEFVPEVGLPWMQELIRSAGGEVLDKFKGYRNGRREFVWTCEYLACFQEYFSICEWILFHLALHETEHGISNNSQGVWSELFGLMLSNTEAPFQDRFCLLLQHMREFQDGWPEQMFKTALSITLSESGTKMLPPKMVGGRLTPEDWSAHNVKTMYDLVMLQEWMLTKLQNTAKDLPGPMKGIVFDCLKTHMAYYTSPEISTHVPRLRSLYCQTLEQYAETPDMRTEIVIEINTQFKMQEYSDRNNEGPDEYTQKRLDFLRQWQEQLFDNRYIVRLKVLLAKNMFGAGEEGQLAIAKMAQEMLDSQDMLKTLDEILLQCNQTDYSFICFAEAVGRADVESRLFSEAERLFAQGDTTFSEKYFYGVCVREKGMPDSIRKLLDKYVDCNPKGVIHISVVYDITFAGYNRICHLLENGIVDNSVLGMAEKRWAEFLSLEQAEHILNLLVGSKLMEGWYQFFYIGCEWIKTFSQVEFAQFLLNHSASMPVETLQQYSHGFIRLMEMMPESLLQDCLRLVIHSLDYSQKMNYLVDHIHYIKKYAVGAYAKDTAFEICDCICENLERSILESPCSVVVRLLNAESVLQWIDLEPQKRSRIIAFHLPAPSLFEVSVPEITQKVLERYQKDEAVFQRFHSGIHQLEVVDYGEVEKNQQKHYAVLAQYSNYPSEPICRWADFEKKRIEAILETNQRLNAERFRFEEL